MCLKFKVARTPQFAVSACTGVALVQVPWAISLLRASIFLTAKSALIVKLFALKVYFN